MIRGFDGKEMPDHPPTGRGLVEAGGRVGRPGVRSLGVDFPCVDSQISYVDSQDMPSRWDDRLGD